MYILIIIPVLWIALIIEFQKSKGRLTRINKFFFLIFIIILTPVSFIILFHTLCYFVQLPIYAFIYIDIIYIPFFIAIALGILGINILRSYNQVNFFNIGTLFFLVSVITIPLAQYIATNYIYNMAQRTYHKQPEYINIEFDCEVRRPHAILLYNGKEYYWSFHTRSFIQGTNLRIWL